MNKEDFKIRTKIIKETFDDSRKIKRHIPTDELELDECIHQEGDFFITEDGEYIDLEFQLVDFTEDELVKFIELAESLYEKYQKEVSIYIICPNNVKIYVREIEILSDAEFTIKLYCSNIDSSEFILDKIKNKLKNEGFLDEDDFHALAMLPLICKPEDRHFYRRESIRIRNRLNY